LDGLRNKGLAVAKKQGKTGRGKAKNNAWDIHLSTQRLNLREGPHHRSALLLRPLPGRLILTSQQEKWGGINR